MKPSAISLNNDEWLDNESSKSEFQMFSKKIIPYGFHAIDDSDIKNVIEVLNSNYLTEGLCRKI